MLVSTPADSLYQDGIMKTQWLNCLLLTVSIYILISSVQIVETL